MNDNYKPDYLAQTGELEHISTMAGQQGWFKDAWKEAQEKGCTFARASWSHEYSLLLFEAWKEQPLEQGDPRFLLTYT